MEVFVEVADQQGFALAARRLGLSTSSVSRHVVNLETRLNRQLFRRTTRHLTLTPAGRDLLESCRQIVHESAALFETVSTESTAPAGRLKLTMPRFLASLLSREMITEYGRRYPDVAIDLVVLNRIVNLVEEDFDLAIRVGDLPDSTLMGRRLMHLQLALVAAPDYLARRGRPQRPEDLRSHSCIVETESPYQDRWPIVGDGNRRYLRVSGGIRVNDGEIARDLACGGAGLALLPIHMVLDELEQGRLQRVLESYIPGFGGISAVYPHTRYLSNNVRSFVECLVEYLEARQVPGRVRPMQADAGSAS